MINAHLDLPAARERRLPGELVSSRYAPGTADVVELRRQSWGSHASRWTRWRVYRNGRRVASVDSETAGYQTFAAELRGEHTREAK